MLNIFDFLTSTNMSSSWPKRPRWHLEFLDFLKSSPKHGGTHVFKSPVFSLPTPTSRGADLVGGVTHACIWTPEPLHLYSTHALDKQLVLGHPLRSGSYSRGVILKKDSICRENSRVPATWSVWSKSGRDSFLLGVAPWIPYSVGRAVPVQDQSLAL